MNINRDNYESYFIDYLDGSLTPEQVGEVRAFLLLNEDLAEMLEDTDLVKLQIPHIKYSGKAALRKDELHACPDYYAIAAAENALTKEDIKSPYRWRRQRKSLSDRRTRSGSHRCGGRSRRC